MSPVTVGYPPRVPSFVRYMQRPPLKYNLPLCSSPLGGSGSGGVNAEQRHQQQGRERQELQEEGRRGWGPREQGKGVGAGPQLL